MLKRWMKMRVGAVADHMACALQAIRFGPPAPASPVHTATLRDHVRDLAEVASAGDGDVESDWLANLAEIRRLMATGDPTRFLRWDVVRRTMFLSNSASVVREWRALQRDREWDRWRSILVEDRVGDPVRFLPSLRTSGNQVHHTYHLCQFERHTGLHVQDARLALEFGGGYGSMCRQVHKLGFRGTYVILDLPEFSCLQRYYLQSIGLPVLPAGEIPSPGTPAVVLVSDIAHLKGLLPNTAAADGPSLFLATWSLSESPVALRRRVLELIRGFDWYLVAFQARFGSVDNEAFFKEWQDSTTGRVKWQQFPIEFMPGNYYLMGSAEPKPAQPVEPIQVTSPG